MAVVPAGVGAARVTGRPGAPALVGNRQGVDVGPEGHVDSRTPAAQQADDIRLQVRRQELQGAGAGRPGGRKKPPDGGGGLSLLEHELRDAVQAVACFNDFW